MIEEFITSRRPHWERLEALLARAHGGRGSRLTAAELEELGRLYRHATSDLAIARRDYPHDRVTRYLEQLVGRAHPVVYRRQAGEWTALLEFFARGFPQAFREAGWYTLVAFTLFAVPFVAAFAAARIDPLVGRMFLPASELVEGIERGQSWLEIDPENRSLVASFIMTNNIQVAFLAFAGGVLLGLGTVYVMIYNGLHIGAVAGLASAYGLGDELTSFVLAHGGIELTVIFIAGGAGLRMGHALLAPGLHSRRVALTLAAQRAIRILFGCVPLLVVAGLFEGFISPSALPPFVKLAVGASATLLLYAYFLTVGRTTDASTLRR